MTEDATPSEIFKERLKKARNLRGYNQEDLAARAEHAGEFDRPF